MGHDGKTIVDHRLTETLTPTQQGNLSGGWSHALFQDTFAQQGVNERAFASVKFAGCHDQKKFVQLFDGAAQLGKVI